MIQPEKLPEISYRRASFADLGNIQSLNLQLVQYDSQFDPTLDQAWSYSETAIAYFRDRIDGNDGILLVAESADKIVGYLVGGITEAYAYRTIKETAELEEMFVLNEYRNCKIGSRLVAEFLVWCAEQQIDDIKVEASAQNIRAIEFYRRMGFADYNLVLEKRAQQALTTNAKNANQD